MLLGCHEAGRVAPSLAAALDAAGLGMAPWRRPLMLGLDHRHWPALPALPALPSEFFVKQNLVEMMIKVCFLHFNMLVGVVCFN